MATDDRSKRRLTWSSGQTIEIPRRTAWELTPLSEEDSKNILHDVARESSPSADGGGGSVPARRDTLDDQETVALNAALEDEHRRALAARFERTGTRVPPRRAGSPFRLLLLGGIMSGIALGLLTAALLLEGPWTPYLDRHFAGDGALAPVENAVATVKERLGL